MTIFRPTGSFAFPPGDFGEGQEHMVDEGLGDGSDATYVEQRFRLDDNGGEIVFDSLPSSFTWTMRLETIDGTTGLNLWLKASPDYSTNVSVLPIDAEFSSDIFNVTSDNINGVTWADDVSAAGCSGPYVFSLGDETGGNRYIRLYDWWIEAGPTTPPPLRQRARSDGLTTDTRQEINHQSSSQKTNLWWVGYR